MYEMVDFTPKAIVFTYVTIMGACVLTYPVVALLVNAITRGASRWR